MEQYKFEKDKTFERDVEKTIKYIINRLKNPSAAFALANEIDNEIRKRSKLPKAFKPYTYDKKKRAIYHVKVNNFYAFYYIDEKKKTMRFIAFIYARMNVSKILK